MSRGGDAGSADSVVGVGMSVAIVGMSTDTELPVPRAARRNSAAPRGSSCPGFGGAGTINISGCTLRLSGAASGAALSKFASEESSVDSSLDPALTAAPCWLEIGSISCASAVELAEVAVDA